MNLINTLILWIWLLGISLLIPTSLPAGGAQQSTINRGEYNIKSPLIAFKEFQLLSTITEKASVLTSVKVGTPVQIIKTWDSPESGKWLLVKVWTHSSYQFFLKRGWVHLGSS